VTRQERVTMMLLAKKSLELIDCCFGLSLLGSIGLCWFLSTDWTWNWYLRNEPRLNEQDFLARHPEKVWVAKSAMTAFTLCPLLSLFYILSQSAQLGQRIEPGP
jgi:hypothetical protein